MTWREKATTVIGRVQKENPEAAGEDLRKLLSAAYPFGLRQHHPYKVWLKEVKKAVKEPAPQDVINFWIQ